jgi:surface antigen
MKRGIARRACSAVAIVLLCSACATTEGLKQDVENNPKAVLGSLLGAGAGAGIAALAGGNPAVIIGSALGGALIGGYIGNRLDNRDKQMAAEAAQRAFDSNPTGTASVWNNPDSGHSGSITPTKTYQLANGQYCRMYTQTINVGNEPQQTYGTACRQPDGSWQVQPS